MKYGSLSRNSVPRKTAGEQLRSDMFAVIITCSLVHLISVFFKALFSPLRYLTMSREQIEREEFASSRKKIEARELRTLGFRQDESDPLIQYTARFIESPEAYAGEEENDTYRQWHEDWSKGYVVDADLRWAPDVYKGGSFNPAFLNYLELQLGNLRGLQKGVFVNTIRKYYPEFTADLSVISDEIEQLRKRSTERELRNELEAKIRKFGLTEKCARELAGAGLTAQETVNRAKVVKRCLEKDFIQSASLCIAENGIDPDSDDASMVNYLMSNAFLPRSVVISFIRKEIDEKQVEKLISFASTTIETLGSNYLFTKSNGTCAFEALMNEKLNELKTNTRRMNSAKAVWEE